MTHRAKITVFACTCLCKTLQATSARKTGEKCAIKFFNFQKNINFPYTLPGALESSSFFFYWNTFKRGSLKMCLNHSLAGTGNLTSPGDRWRDVVFHTRACSAMKECCGSKHVFYLLDLLGLSWRGVGKCCAPPLLF